MAGVIRAGVIGAGVKKEPAEKGPIRYSNGRKFRANIPFAGSIPPYTNLSEICTDLFRVYVIAKSSAFQLTKFVEVTKLYESLLYNYLYKYPENCRRSGSTL